ncbi:energy-coupling factor transporter transmembrane component T family protein [Paenibacillus sp. sgz302251]|uniref:energy-coupling factor transporter transmembrane component T family protein n=1 Tax=Paenibacillus sp. sgz302251 TaxID=3414493 RepID=UPI003C7E876B
MQLTFPHHQTWLHRVNPGLKLLLFIALFVVVLLVHNLNILINLTIGVLLLLALWSGHPWKRLLLYSSPFLLVFLSTSTGMMLFGQGSTTWLRYGLIHITEESFFRGLHLGFRALNMAAAGLMFGLTTRPVYLFYSLMQQYKLPPKYAYSFLAAMRMLPLLLEEFQTLRHALKVRGVRNSYTPRGLYLTIQRYAIPLLAQSIRRAQRIAIAMESRQFTNDAQRTYYYKVGYSASDLVFALYFIIVLIFSYWFGTAWPYFEVTDVRGMM